MTMIERQAERREVRWERMFPDELEAAFSECPVVYFPYGLCEPHGPQNAVGLDALKAHGIACATARRHGGIVAPPDYWHIHEVTGYATWLERNVGNVARSWMTCVPPWQHFRNVLYHIRQADDLGFRVAIFLTGHYGPNWKDLKLILGWVQPYARVRLFGLPDFEANQPGFDRDGKSGGDHAGKVETSLLWALEPDCVDLSRLPTREALAADSRQFAMGANAFESNRLVGQRMVADEVDWLGAAVARLLTEAESAPSASGIRTFAEVEQVWLEVVFPRLRELHTLQQEWPDRPAPTEESRWRANWQVPTRVLPD